MRLLGLLCITFALGIFLGHALAWHRFKNTLRHLGRYRIGLPKRTSREWS